MNKSALSISFFLMSLLALTSCAGPLRHSSSSSSSNAPSYSQPMPMASNPEARSYQEQAALLQHQNKIYESTELLMQIQPVLSSSEEQRQNATAIWGQLQHISQNDLVSSQARATQPDAAGWLSLAIISKTYANDTPQLVQQLLSWQQQFPKHPGNLLLPKTAELQALLTSKRPQHIALLLPLQGNLGQVGKIVKDGFLSAYYESRNNGGTEQAISFYDTTQAGSNVNSLYLQALAEGADAVIGPLTKDSVQNLLQSGRSDVPTLTLNYADAGSSSRVFQFGLSPVDEAEQVATDAWRDGHANILIIAPQGDWGRRVGSALQNRWTQLGGHVADKLYFSTQLSLTHDIAVLLKAKESDPHATKAQRLAVEKNNSEPKRRQDIDAIFLAVQPDAAREIIPLLRFYYAADVPVYGISSIYAGNPNPTRDTDLNGIKFCDIPWLLNPNMPQSNQNNKQNRMYAVGRDAYILSNSLERLAFLPHFPIEGATGKLSMNSEQKIYRQLQWAEIQNGVPNFTR